MRQPMNSASYLYSEYIKKIRKKTTIIIPDSINFQVSMTLAPQRLCHRTSPYHNEYIRQKLTKNCGRAIYIVVACYIRERRYTLYKQLIQKKIIFRFFSTHFRITRHEK